MKFTKEEIESAEAVKHQMMNKETPDTLKAIYMAGEIFMYEEMKVKNVSSNSSVMRSLPDIYSGKLNTMRIKKYKKLAEEYNISEGTVRDIFCKGADWHKEVLLAEDNGA